MESIWVGRATVPRACLAVRLVRLLRIGSLRRVDDMEVEEGVGLEEVCTLFH